MKLNMDYRKIALTVFATLISAVNAFAQIGLPGDGDVDDVPAAPIDDYVFVFFFGALLFGVWILRRNFSFQDKLK